MKVKAEISMDIPRSLYCGRLNGKRCDYAAMEQSMRLQPNMFCTLYKTYLGTTKKGMIVKCDKCLKNIRKELLNGG